MSDPAPSTSTWVMLSTGTPGTATYSQATAGGIGGGGVTFSNFDANMPAITEQPHREDKHRG